MWRVEVEISRKNVLAYESVATFSAGPRLQRLFSSRKTAKKTQWHKLKRIPKPDILSHPADGEAWKEFDIEWETFAADPRNIRLSLATHEFNPYGTMSTSYSMWPVFAVPYNFAPWDCMDQ